MSTAERTLAGQLCMQADYLEIKLHKNKPAQQFRCALLHRQPAYAVLLYYSEDPGRIADMHVEPGSTTVAHYWQERPYVAWRMFNRNGRLLGTLFHICTNVSIHADHLSYEDLLLDIWIAPDGSIRILDEPELQTCAADGRISETELRHICEARHAITSNHDAIIAHLNEFEKTHAGTLCLQRSTKPY